MTQMIILALDGEAILLKNIAVSITLQLPDKDMSGQSSSTTGAEKGTKAKEMRVSGSVDFKDAHIITRIFQMAEATDAGGARKRYRIANATASAVNMRQGIFSGGVDVTEQQGKLHWQVTFTLKEKLSVPEKAAGRKNGGNGVKVKQQTQNGSEDVGTAGESKMNTQNAFWGNINKWAGQGLDAIGVGSVKES
ncbi:hypothetical protein J4872_002668 [Escherichia coli]|uniref:baseplate complex protein n=1 Tax=Escherichia coli TaxID=562 RepID=UPI000DA54CDB|nr:hypothetical protein [Escherichia coli]EEW2300098.1 hypothetical protein [Escherichia coli]EFH6212892.1 hypothetical protein [Escherichia coli]EFH9514532.1 hypothetical protein [Escherichia coli]EFI2446356.1 hypothetical protein [Escherichia coli]EFJ3028314.1 hypothetical protein [Escherichia coli]